jgi:hypothetical protein
MAKILEFPKTPKAIKNKELEMDHELDIARECMKAVVSVLYEYQYYPQDDEQLAEDLGLVYHIMYAMMLRTDGQYHQFHEMMEEIMKELKRQRDDNK